MTSKILIITVLILTALIGSIPCLAANDRPLLFGMNPIPMDWWGYDPLVWDPLQFQKMKDAGCASARIGLNWDLVEPTKGQRDWSGTDRWVNYCLDNNIEPLILINSTPRWALPEDADLTIPSPEGRYPAGESHSQDFENWCYDIARRYRGRVRYYEFWNEANGYGWYTAVTNPQSFSRADLYTPWMIRAYKNLKLADPTCQMSTTGIDDGGDGHAAYFINLIYANGGQGYFDAVADHPYTVGTGFQPWKMDQIREALDARGDTHVKVWITEFGFSMDPSQYPTYQQQMTGYFNALTQDQYNYVRIATWHTATEFPWEAGYGLMNKDLTAKPPYTTFKNYAKPSRPAITTISVTNLSATSVKISYMTSVAAKGMVMYGVNNTYGSVTARDSTGLTSHQHTLVGLKPGTTYHYRIRAGRADIEDTDSFSADRTFTTTMGQAVQVTSGPTVTDVTNNTATVTWSTSVPSTTGVDYGLSFNYGSTAYSSALVTNHTIQLTGLEPGKNYQYRVASTASGYAAAAVEGNPFTTIDAGGTLRNGGFELGTHGWTFWEVYPWGNDNGNNGVDYPGHITIYNNGGSFVPTPASMEGSWRMTGDVGYASAVGGLYQSVTVENGTYMVSGWMAMGGDGGTELVELRAVDGAYTSGIPGGTLVAQMTGPSGWKFFAAPVQVTQGMMTVATRVSQYWAIGAVAGHFDGISIAPCTQAGITGIKARQENEAVATDSHKIVTMIVDENTFYMQEDNRLSGIKVHTSSPHGLSLNARVSVAGTLKVVSGEALIDNAYATYMSQGTAPAPAGIMGFFVGGSAAGVQPAVGNKVGVSNTGLLIRVWGRIVERGDGYIKIDDGSGSVIKCRLPSNLTVDPTWDYVAVTGISSCYMDGSNILPMVRMRGAGDIRDF